MFPQRTQWTMEVRPQIDFLKVHVHFCWILRNCLGISFLTGEKTLMSLSLFLCMSFHSTAKADNLISNIIVHYMKVIFFLLPFFNIYFIHHSLLSRRHAHEKHTHFSINLPAILKWIILNSSNIPLRIFVTLNWDIAGSTTIRAELFPQVLQRAEHWRAIFQPLHL